MSLTGDALKTLRDVVLMNEKITRLSASTERLEHEQRNLADRLIRLETIIDLAREATGRRALPTGL